ncbi:D-inositol-3-phosphate glycosyltransferase [compost metagenome]
MLVQPDDVAGLSAAMRRLAEDEALREDLRARGLARSRLFSWDKAAAATLDVYRELA